MSGKESKDTGKQERNYIKQTVMRLLMDSTKYIDPKYKPEIEEIKSNKIYCTIRDHRGSNSIVEIDKESYIVKTNMSKEYMQDVIAALAYDFYESRQLSEMANINDLNEIYRYWKSNSLTLKMEYVEWVLEKSHIGLCFHRHDFDYDHEPTPYFDEIFDRIDNADALKMFIGSLFYKNSNTQQYVVLKGPGNDGKSLLIDMIGKALGSAYIATNPPDRGEKHWSATLINKRLAAITELNNTGFLRSGVFKAITGGDSIKVENKFQDAYHQKIPCKFIFSTNYDVEISSRVCDMRRIILCNFKPLARELPEGVIKQALMKELPSFIRQCREAFESLSNPTMKIPTNTDSLMEEIESYEEWFHSIFESHFEPREFNPKCSTAGPGGWITATDMTDICATAKLTGREKKEFYAWLKRVKNLIPTRIGHARLRVWGGAVRNFGCSSKTDSNRTADGRV